MNDYYTYAYLREDGTPYYVGKGVGDRIHSYSRHFKPPIKERRIFLKQNLTESEALNHEIYMIAVLGRKDLGTGILHNKTDGGEGGSPMRGRRHSEETKLKMRQTKLGKKHSAQERKNMSEAHKGITYPNRKSKPQTEEHKRNRSIAVKEWWRKRKEAQNGN